MATLEQSLAETNVVMVTFVVQIMQLLFVFCHSDFSIIGI